LVDAILWPSDHWKIVKTYRKAFGHAPNLLRRSTFNEKLQQSKLFRRRALYTCFGDKVTVRDYVARTIGAQYLTKILWTGVDLREAMTFALPQRFVIKSNQGSNTNIIVTDAQSFDWDAAHGSTRQWLKHDHSVLFAEWQYRWIQPKLLIEEFLAGRDGGVPLDYKFYCFHGRVEMVQVDFDRFTNHTRSLYDRDFLLLNAALLYPRHPAPAPKHGPTDDAPAKDIQNSDQGITSLEQ
jgi:TupA-like ATPgrasp